MSTERRKAQYRASYYKHHERNLAVARARYDREKGIPETPEEAEARRAYNRAYYAKHTGPERRFETARRTKAMEVEQAAEWNSLSDAQKLVRKRILIGLLAQRYREVMDYRRDWKRKAYGYKPRCPKVPKPPKIKPPPLTEEELQQREGLRKQKTKEYHQRPDVKVKKALSRKKHYEGLKARAKSDPEFAAQLRLARQTAGMKWAEKIKYTDPERYAQLISAYKERQRHRRHLQWKNEEYRKQRYAWFRNRRKTCPEFRLCQYIRNGINHALRGRRRTSSAFVLVGCSPEELRVHLEKQFQPGMSWETHGKGEYSWQIDHVRPLASFNMADPEQQKLAFNFKNLKPEWALINASKNSLYEGKRWRYDEHEACNTPTTG